MDIAINKTTGRLVSAFEVHKNGSYQDLNKGEWIAPLDSIHNWDEIEEEDSYVHYVSEKRYTNWRGTNVACSPYFAIYPGSNAKTVAEGKEHKALKNWLFNRLENNDLEIIYSVAGKKHKYDNIVKLSELDVDWNKYEIEVHTRGYKSLRADILIQFKNKHPFLGEGIFIEVQLSKQNDRTTFDRSISRAIQGYSTMWLFEKDFTFNKDLTEIELKENKVKVHSFSSELKYNGKRFVSSLRLAVEEQCRFIDEKIDDLLSIEKKLEIKGLEIEEQIKQSLKSREAILFNKIKNLENNPFESLVNKYKQEIEEKGLYIIDEIEESNNKFNPRVIPCAKCNIGNMIFKITPNKGKELYECQTCKNIIWVK